VLIMGLTRFFYKTTAFYIYFYLRVNKVDYKCSKF